MSKEDVIEVEGVIIDAKTISNRTGRCYRRDPA